MDRLEYVGVLALELFSVDGTLLANEMAPRVHNSGHWTIEGAETSQFENHLRAILALPLGVDDPRGRSVMLNILGHIPPAESRIGGGGRAPASLWEGSDGEAKSRARHAGRSDSGERSSRDARTCWRRWGSRGLA